jgi:MerR family transcriptional regulator, thiopeptide resistance regulator
MKDQTLHRVQEFAQLTGVSIRTLHYYDEIGLLVPKARTATGYRLYDDADALRLQQVLILRELGFSLADIRHSLDDPGFDHREALLAQKQQLQKRAQHTQAMLEAIDAALGAIAGTNKGNTMDMKQLFNGFDPSQYEEEAKDRWGHTDAYRESQKRTKRYTPEDWQAFAAEQAAIYRDAVAAMSVGKQPGDEEVLQIAERARLLIDRWFYPCSTEMHARLADLYESDGRFAENIDKHGAGLTPFLVAAIRANSARSEHD